jgi:hypothetical protein
MGTIKAEGSRSAFNPHISGGSLRFACLGGGDGMV